MRTFIALKTPPFEEELFAIETSYKEIISDVSWVGCDNLHVTVKFLGEIDAKILIDVGNMLQIIAEKQSPFNFSISGVSGFPVSSNARVLFFRIDDGYHTISSLMKEVSLSLTKFGFEEEKSYVPHITFARAKRSPVNLDKIAFERFTIQSKATGLIIMKSDLSRGEPVYSVVSEFDFFGK
ncbi:MAG: RNA 2',3'-cyclic phosphodiesterase [Caldisericaceae bacterium]